MLNSLYNRDPQAASALYHAAAESTTSQDAWKAWQAQYAALRTWTYQPPQAETTH